MGLASDYGEKVTIPHDAENWLELRELGAADFKAARQEKQREANRELQERGGDLYAVLLRARSPGAAKSIPDPIYLYDEMTVLDRALTGWSFPTPLPPRSDNPSDRRLREAIIGKLKPKDSTWAFRYVMDQAGIDNAWGDADADAIDVSSREVGPRLLESADAEDGQDEADPSSRSWLPSTGT